MPASLLGTFTFAEGTGTTLTTGSRTTTAGSLITAHAAAWDTPTRPTISLSDNQGNSYTSASLDYGTADRMVFGYNANGTRAAGHTITATLSAGQNGGTVSAAEWDGVSLSPTVVDNSITQSLTTTPSVSVTAGSSSLFVGLMGYSGNPTTFAPSNGATEAIEADENATFQPHGVAYKAGLSGSQSIDWTLGASRNTGAMVFAFTEAAVATWGTVNDNNFENVSGDGMRYSGGAISEGGTLQSFHLYCMSFFAGAVGRLAVYQGGATADPDGPPAATKVWDSGQVSLHPGGANAWLTFSASGNFSAGQLWLCVKCNDGQFALEETDRGDLDSGSERSGAINNDASVAFPDTWPTETPNTGAEAIKAYITYTAAGGGTEFFQSVGGSLSFSGTISKRTAISQAASLTFTGALGTTAVFLKALDGAVSFAGALSKQTRKGLGAILSFNGALVKRTGKNLSGALNFTGNLLSSLVTSQALSGAVSFVGTVVGLLIPFSGTVIRVWRAVWQRVWRAQGGENE